MANGHVLGTPECTNVLALCLDVGCPGRPEPQQRLIFPSLISHFRDTVEDPQRQGLVQQDPAMLCNRTPALLAPRKTDLQALEGI